MSSNIPKDINFASIRVATGLFIFSAVLVFFYLAQEILFPIILAFIFAILLIPIVHFLNKKLHFSNSLSAFVSILITSSILVGIFIFLGKQIGNVFADLPEIERNLRAHQVDFQAWIFNQFGMTIKEQKDFLIEQVNSKTISSSGSLKSLESLSSVLLNFVLVPIYTFLILIYRHTFVEFIFQLKKNQERKYLIGILSEITSVVRSYIVGLLIEMPIVAILTGVGLAIIGVKYFVFLGILTAILNLIPYIGILIAAVISILLTLVGPVDLNVIIGIVVVNTVVQFIDNNILIPKIVGSKVSINAFASMVGVIVGGAIAGIGGMFLALPILAIVKVIFDKTENLKAFGTLLGEGKK